MTKPSSAAIITVWLAAASVMAPARAEPLSLTDGQLDSVAAGGLTPEFGMPSAAYFDRSTQITTHFSMPSSTAIAICLLCSGNASANAVANAMGLGQAGALSFSTGEGKSSALSNAVGPYLLLLPQIPSAPSRDSGGSKE